MQSLRIRVARVIDFGPTVAIVGNELVSNLGVVLNIDYRPMEKIERDWQSAGLSQKIQFDADSLVLRLEMDFDGPNGGELAQCKAA